MGGYAGPAIAPAGPLGYAGPLAPAGPAPRALGYAGPAIAPAGPLGYAGPLAGIPALVAHPNGAVVPADEPAVVAARADHLAAKGAAFHAAVASGPGPVGPGPVGPAAPAPAGPAGLPFHG